MLKNIFFLCLLIIFQYQILIVASQTQDDVSEQAKAQVPDGYRIVRNSVVPNDPKYDVIEYKWNITGYQKTGEFGYYVYSEMGVCTLLMNSTEYNTWVNKEYKLWLKSTDYQFNFLSDNLESFMCQSPVATCRKSPVRFPDKELYMVILPRPEDVGPTYVMYDQVNLNNPNAAELVYDPIKGNLKQDNSSTMTMTLTVQSNSPTETNYQTQTETPKNSKDDEDDDDNTILYLVIGGIALLIAIVVITLLICSRKKNDRKLIPNSSSSMNSIDGENINAKKVAAGYVPHHTMKRVAYRYTCSTLTLEKNDFIELIERYNDGWVKVINPIDAQEYTIPLIILEGDYEDDLTNIPLVENNDERLLSTPENLFENKFISQEDYDEMKRNDDWFKKVRLMKRSKTESLAEVSINNIRFSDETSSIKNNPHHFQRPQVALENSIASLDSYEKSEKRKAIKSMVATLELEDSNAELLAADHVMEIYNNDDDDDNETEEKKEKENININNNNSNSNENN